MFQTGYFYFSPVTFTYREEIEVSQSSAGDTGVSSAEWTAAPLTAEGTEGMDSLAGGLWSPRQW